LRFFRTAPQPCISAETLACLTLLSLAVLLRKTGRGFFSILRSPGIGGKISRRLTPIVLLVPFALETLRVRLLGVNRIAPSYVTALLASTVSILSLTLVLYCAWRIFAMEKEIHALSLLDPLTGLHNLRGFELLASQALLIAQRSGLGFSVLFLDLDGLKQTNDTFGHAAGSQVLVETGEILKKALPVRRTGNLPRSEPHREMPTAEKRRAESALPRPLQPRLRHYAVRRAGNTGDAARQGRQGHVRRQTPEEDGRGA
jgi:predicted signal transduction protein with EAL and GGDEF domain